MVMYKDLGIYTTFLFPDRSPDNDGGSITRRFAFLPNNREEKRIIVLEPECITAEENLRIAQPPLVQMKRLKLRRANKVSTLW